MAAQPMTLDELYEQVGRRVPIPDDVIYFARGKVGLRQHFPDFGLALVEGAVALQLQASRAGVRAHAHQGAAEDGLALKGKGALQKAQLYVPTLLTHASPEPDSSPATTLRVRG